MSSFVLTEQVEDKRRGGRGNRDRNAKFIKNRFLNIKQKRNKKDNN